MKLILRQLLGYGAASAAALAVDMTILWGLVHFFGWNYLAAAVVSFFGGAVVAYILSLHLAFHDHRLRDRRVEFLSFVVIGIFGLAVNSIVMTLAVNILALHYLLAKCLAAGFTFLCNFMARRQLLFVRERLNAPTLKVSQ